MDIFDEVNVTLSDAEYASKRSAEIDAEIAKMPIFDRLLIVIFKKSCQRLYDMAYRHGAEDTYRLTKRSGL